MAASLAYKNSLFVRVLHRPRIELRVTKLVSLPRLSVLKICSPMLPIPPIRSKTCPMTYIENLEADVRRTNRIREEIAEETLAFDFEAWPGQKHDSK